MKKVLSIITVIVIVVIAALFAFIKIYITPERVKAFVVPAAEDALGREVEIGGIDINIFEGIGLKDFAVKEADGERDFVSCDEFVLRFKLLPLFAKQVVIDQVMLDSPEIRVRRGKDGIFNFEDIGKKEEPVPAEEKGTAEDEQDGQGSGLPVSLLVDSIVIRDAKFSLADLKKGLPDLKTTTDVDISIQSAGTSKISTRGTIDLIVDELVMRGTEEGLIRDLKAGIDYDILVDLETLDLQIEKANVEFQEIPVSVTGTVSGLKEDPGLDLAVSLPRFDVAKAMDAASSFVTIEGLGLSGGVAADIKIKGKPAKLDSMNVNGDITLDKVGVSHGEIDAMLDGGIRFSKELIDLKLDASTGRNKAELTGSVRNYFENQDIKMDVYSKKLYIDELIPAPAAVKETGALPEKDKAGDEKTPQKEAEPLELKLKAEGTVKVDSAEFKGLTMSNFVMKYIFKENKLTISRMTANAGKGELGLKSSVDLSKPGYEYDLACDIDSLHADEIVNALFPAAKDTVFGVLSLDLSMKGAGTLPENIKKNLVADAGFNIKDGKLTNAELTKKFSGFLDIAELETINLREAKGTVQVRDRVAKLESVFFSDDLAMDPKGTIGLDETLDLEFELRLSPRLTDKAVSSKVGTYLKDDEGWGVLPLTVAGTFSNPSFAVDVEKAGKRAIKKEADKFIDKLIEKNIDEDKKDELAPVKDLIKGLFR